MERKKPMFVRQDWHKFQRLGQKLKKLRKWRAPKGSSSKVRKGRKGHPRKVKIGWGSKKEGIKTIVLVENMMQLEKAAKGTAIVIAGSVGGKKRELLMAKAKENGLTILNKYTGAKK